MTTKKALRYTPEDLKNRVNKFRNLIRETIYSVRPRNHSFTDDSLLFNSRAMHRECSWCSCNFGSSRFLFNHKRDSILIYSFQRTNFMTQQSSGHYTFWLSLICCCHSFTVNFFLYAFFALFGKPMKILFEHFVYLFLYRLPSIVIREYRVDARVS